MGRFYFHLRASDQLVSDEDGQDFPDVSASVPDALVIEDEAGREIDTVPLAMVLPESLKK